MPAQSKVQQPPATDAGPPPVYKPVRKYKGDEINIDLLAAHAEEILRAKPFCFQLEVAAAGVYGVLIYHMRSRLAQTFAPCAARAAARASALAPVLVVQNSSSVNGATSGLVTPQSWFMAISVLSSRSPVSLRLLGLLGQNVTT
ncbi:hypothetical protein C8R47DRAFT_1064134 [Mycena vitilis]|nr:hypothetical protein C8R47DRAFT_1064134 [Mycena vitilis]